MLKMHENVIMKIIYHNTTTVQMIHIRLGPNKNAFLRYCLVFLGYVNIARDDYKIIPSLFFDSVTTRAKLSLSRMDDT